MFIRYFVVLTLFILSVDIELKAKDVSGRLAAGEGSSFVPSQGSAFSIISDLKSGIYDGRFNILIKSGGRIIYQESDQVDDLYLVFNEPVSDGDIIKLDVIKGVFIFKMSHMDTLPDVIVDAIKEQAPAEYKQLKPLHKRKNRKSKKKDKSTKKVVKQQTVKIKPNKVTKKSVSLNKSSESRVIRRHIEPEEYKKDIQQDKTDLNRVINEPFLGEKVQVPSILKPSVIKQDLGKISSSIDHMSKDLTTIDNYKKREIDKSLIKSDIESVAKSSKIEPPRTSVSSMDSIPIAKTFPLDRVTAPSGIKSEAPNPKTVLEDQNLITTPSIDTVQTGKFHTEISTQPVVNRPDFKVSEPEVVVKRIKIDQKIKRPIMNENIERAPTSIPEPKIEPEIIKYEEPEVAIPEQDIIESNVVRTEPKPKVTQKPYHERSETKDKIVITKTIIKPKEKSKKEESRVIKRHIEPQEYKEEIPERMSDRVIGGGYGGVATPGRIKVKAYSNNRPVSAWVEVFRADTKQRVKTFYTGKGRSLKDVKLPAGVYVIKATYRTAGSKRKKTIGRVTLQEGGSINKSIYFDDGTIKVKVTKNGKPIYAKVEVFKSGKKRRITYEFTSRTTGIAKLSLGSGRYDIVVRDHLKVRRFDSIRVRGGKSRTLNADF